MTDKELTDETLVAFLDGVLPEGEEAEIAFALTTDPALAVRVEALAVDTEVLKSEFDALLGDAPALQLPEAATPAPTANLRQAPQGWKGMAVAAAVAFAVGIGAGFGAGFGLSGSGAGSAETWHMAVADYQVLYTTATLDGVPVSDAQRTGGLQLVSQALGITLTEATVAIPGMSFRRAQILHHNGKPLAQLAYLDAAGNPVAFCMTRTGADDQGATVQEISGLNAVTWDRGGIGFIVIGPAAPADLSDAQAALSAQISI